MSIFGVKQYAKPANITPANSTLFKPFLDLILDLVRDKNSKPYEAFRVIETSFRTLFEKVNNILLRLFALEQPLRRCELFHSVDQSVPGNGVLTIMTFDSEEWDNDNMHDSVTPTRITFRTAGWYDVGYCFELADNGVAGYCVSIIQLTSPALVTTIVKDARGIPSTGGLPAKPVAVNSNRIYKFERGDYIELYISQNTGAPTDAVHLGNYSVRFWAHMHERKYNRNELPNRME